MRYLAAVLLCLIPAGPVAWSSTIFVAASGERTFVGHNEDNVPGTAAFLWFHPSRNGSYGYVTWGFDERFPAGGVNEKGLFYDAAALAERIPIVKEAGKTDYEADLVEPLLRQCATVEEALRFAGRYNLMWQERTQVLLADRSGDYAVLHANYVIHQPERPWFVLTNFALRGPEAARAVCYRRKTAEKILSQPVVSGKDFQRLLERTAQREPDNATLYSQVIDLQDPTVTLYQQGDFRQPRVLRLSDELLLGERQLEMLELFPPTLEQRFERGGLEAVFDVLRHGGKTSEQEIENLGYSLLNADRLEEAIELFGVWRHALPSARSYSALATAYLKAAQPQRAKTLYGEARRMNPDDYLAGLMGGADGVVRIRLWAFPEAGQVGVAGRFNGYDAAALPLRREGESWVGEIRLPEGDYPYKLLVDGAWHVDPANGMRIKTGAYWDSLLLVRQNGARNEPFAASTPLVSNGAAAQ